MQGYGLTTAMLQDIISEGERDYSERAGHQTLSEALAQLELLQELRGLLAEVAYIEDIEAQGKTAHDARYNGTQEYPVA